ncbi:short-chain dehydrogenase/reductase [Roseateles aquatilis]|uniref:Short-chain dehydrogenase/reductase n=1 Tax=Roseateles aquatilis TaxID=431061 RepID=A0A246JGZ7_9BURK|nr:SDR family oxidoreductase [Roseateles aquatilis]OWQ91884.1 short-chain dehydrogenase/reductase [Roseateles aquatilis]
MKTVLITGCSSGFGLEAARHFHARGWRVIATMRSPRPELLPLSDTMHVATLDVTKPESIARLLESCGPIDVLVNNAGIGLFGAAEATPMATVREVFETNTFGVIAMCQAVIPRFRERQGGTIINVTSSATLAAMPLVAAYTASKTAIEGYTASLEGELGEFGVRVKLVQPGYGPTTSFTTNGQERMQGSIPETYAAFAHRVFATFAQNKAVTKEVDVAEAIWRAANDASDQLRFPAGEDAVALAKRHEGEPRAKPVML